MQTNLSDLEKNARARIVENFSAENRKKILMEELAKLG
jgi:hypothetical protein